MQEWKKRIFIRVIKTKMEETQKSAEEIIAVEFPKLTEEERAEILAELEK